MKNKLVPSMMAFMTAISVVTPTMAAEAKNEVKTKVVAPNYLSKEAYAQWKQSLIGGGNVASTFSLDNGLVDNEFLAFKVADNGQFTIGTTGGNPDTPADDNKKIMYNHPNPGSSYTTLNIDGESKRFNDLELVDSKVDYDNLTQTVIKKDGDLEIKQVLKIIGNSSTARKDIVEIRYYVTNTSTENAHEVGSRIMFDTQLGDNDAAAFQVPGIGAVTTETELSGEQIPQYWQAFDSLENPTVVSQGTFYKKVSEKPDKVQFTNWGGVNREPWNYAISPGRDNGDSAVSMYWNPKAIAAGGTQEFVTYYGLGELKQNTEGPMSLSVTGPRQIDVENNAYVQNPFTVTAYIQNTSDVTRNNVQASLDLPEGLTLANGEEAVKTFDSVSAGQQIQVSWKVNISPSRTERNVDYKVNLTTEGLDAKSVSTRLNIPGLRDTTAPTIENVVVSGTKGENGWYTSDVGVEARAQDPESGIDQIQYKINSGEFQPFQSPVTLSDNGETAFTSVAYNGDSLKSEESTLKVKIDKETPSINVTTLSFKEGDELDLTPLVSDSVSGIQSITYKLGTNDEVNGATVKFTKAGQQDLVVKVKDNAGNIQEKTYQVSVQAPVTLLQAKVTPIPGVINKKYPLPFVTVAIDVLGDYANKNIDIHSVLINGTAKPISLAHFPDATMLVDINGDKKKELLLVFKWSDLKGYVKDGSLPISLQGKINEQTFSGSTSIKIK